MPSPRARRAGGSGEPLRPAVRPRGESSHCRGVAQSRASPSAHLVGAQSICLLHTSPPSLRARSLSPPPRSCRCCRASAAQALPTLHHGDRGHSVAKLQRALHLHADGVFGRGTVRAVKRFQRRHHLHADGVVGAGTWRMIRRSLRGHGAPARERAPRRASPRGRACACSSAASASRPTASSAPGTARAVRRFQRAPRPDTPTASSAPRRGPRSASAAATPCSSRARLPPRPASGQRRPRGRVARDRRRQPHRRLPVQVTAAATAPSTTRGYDCSGSVSYVLHATGRLAGRGTRAS